MNKGDAKALYALFDDGMKSAISEDKLAAMMKGIVEAHGKLLGGTAESGVGENGGSYRVKAERGEWKVMFATTNGGKISGLRFAEPGPPEPAITKSPLLLSLPFKGQWSVFWGGDNKTANYHVAAGGSQRRATDLVMVDASGKSHKGDGKKNEDYFAFGQDIIAVADGTVVQAVDGVVDNEPGVMSPLMAIGNHVVIEHAGKVFSMYAHLRNGKLKVKAGAAVRRGDVLGVCGNSGNTSEPHLHFQLQDGPQVDHSFGIEPQFAAASVTRGGKTSVMNDYTWLKGDLVGAVPKK